MTLLLVMSSTQLARSATAVAGEPKERSVRLRRYKGSGEPIKSVLRRFTRGFANKPRARMKLNQQRNLFQLAESKAAIEEDER